MLYSAQKNKIKNDNKQKQKHRLNVLLNTDFLM